VLHNVGFVLATQIEQVLLEQAKLNRKELLGLLRCLITNVGQVLSQLLNSTLVSDDGVVLVLLVVLLEQSLLATVGTRTNHVAQLLRHFPESAVIVESILNFMDLFSDVGSDVVNFTVLADKVDVGHVSLGRSDSREGEFLVNGGDFLLLRHIDGVVTAALARQLGFFHLLDDDFAVLAEDGLEAGHHRRHLDNLLDKVSDRLLDSVVGGLRHDFRLVLVFVEDGVDAEDGHNLLGVAVHMLLEIDERVLNSVFKRFL